MFQTHYSKYISDVAIVSQTLLDPFNPKIRDTRERYQQKIYGDHVFLIVFNIVYSC